MFQDFPVWVAKVESILNLVLRNSLIPDLWAYFFTFHLLSTQYSWPLFLKFLYLYYNYSIVFSPIIEGNTSQYVASTYQKE